MLCLPLLSNASHSLVIENNPLATSNSLVTHNAIFSIDAFEMRVVIDGSQNWKQYKNAENTL